MLTGRIVAIEPVRYTPAGVPGQRVWLEHRSRQEEAGHPREVRARLALRFVGESAVRGAEALQVDRQIRAEGFLCRAGIRGDARDVLQLHVQHWTAFD